MLSIYVFLVRYSRYRWYIFGIICDITVWVTWSCKWHSNKLCVRQKEVRRGLLSLCLKFPWVYFKKSRKFLEITWESHSGQKISKCFDVFMIQFDYICSDRLNQYEIFMIKYNIITFSSFLFDFTWYILEWLNQLIFN